jgi:hypothetical protein
MRVHVYLDDDLVAAIDKRVGERGRSGFIAESVREALENEERWALIRSAMGSIKDAGHDWDDDPAAWVRAQRRGDRRRVG